MQVAPLPRFFVAAMRFQPGIIINHKFYVDFGIYDASTVTGAIYACILGVRFGRLGFPLVAKSRRSDRCAR